MAKLTNLNRVRKSRARAAKRAKADANSTKFGRSKAEKDVSRARDEKASRDLDGHRRE